MAKKRSVSNLIGSWSFFIGFILSIVMGLGFTGSYQTTVIWVVFLLGIIVGLLNIAASEVSPFLMAGTVLVLVSFFGITVGMFDTIAPAIANVLRGILTLFVPATIVVAIKSVFVMAEK